MADTEKEQAGGVTLINSGVLKDKGVFSHSSVFQWFLIYFFYF